MDEDTQLLRKRDVAALLKTCEATVMRMVDRGEFPKPFRLHLQPRWRRATVLLWLAEKEKDMNHE